MFNQRADMLTPFLYSICEKNASLAAKRNSFSFMPPNNVITTCALIHTIYLWLLLSAEDYDKFGATHSLRVVLVKKTARIYGIMSSVKSAFHSKFRMRTICVQQVA